MKVHTSKTQEKNSQSPQSESAHLESGGESTYQMLDKRPETTAHQKIQEAANGSQRVSQLRALQDKVNNSPQVKQAAQLQAIASKGSVPQQPIQKAKNDTGLPDNLKEGMESISNVSLDDVNVIHNSSEPAQLQAHAFAQGTDIHVAPGQEKHLPHEAWHVVQQKQGRVQPTKQLKGKVNINDDEGLEREADEMGAKALQTGKSTAKPIQQKSTGSSVTQLKIQTAQVYGITHLVKMVDGSLYNEDFLSNEGRQMNDGDVIEIETQSKIGSRRGPNQESYKEEDKDGPQHYMWYQVKSVNGEPIAEPFYIREDTFTPVNASSSSEVSSSGTSDFMKDASGGILDSIASGSGITGDYGDRSLVGAPKEYSGNHMDREGGAKLNNAYFDIGEGANIGLGGLKMMDARAKWKDGDKAEAVATGLEGAGQTIHGGAKLTKGIALLNGGNSTTWTKVGDVGAAFGDGLSCIGGMITTFKSVKDAWADRKSSTTSEKVDSAADIAGGVLGVATSGVNTAKDVIKIGSEVGSQGFRSLSSTQATQHIANLAQAAAIMGIVTGSIQMIHGFYQGVEAFKRAGQVHKVKESITSALISLSTEKIPAIEDQRKSLAADLYSKVQSAEANREEIMAQGETAMNEIVASLEELQQSLTQLEAFYNEYAPTMDAMTKIQSRNMERAGLKIASNAAGVASGALLLSGVGAPIAVGVAAIGGIIALGSAGVQYSRNKAAKRAFGVASKLDDSGQPSKNADPEPSYRTMESRMFKNYYRNLKRTMNGDKSFEGLTKDETREVKQFGWNDKKARLKSEDRHEVRSISEVDGLGDAVKKERWIQVRTARGKVTHNEKPKGMEWLRMATTGSAHKSKTSMESSAAELADALYNLGMGSFSEGKFIDCKVNPLDDGGDRPDMQSLKNHTSSELLKAADITDKKWQAWLKSTGGDVTKMKESIKKHVSR